MNSNFGSIGPQCMRQVAALAAVALTVGLAGASAPSAGAAITTCSGTGGTFAGGAGTSADPYLVANQAQLEEIRSSTYRTCAFRQTSDISLTGGSWTSIGTGASMFAGEYDGDNHRISDLLITTAVNGYEGLFGYTGNGAVIKNIRLSGAVNLPVDSGVGALVGLADRPTTITNVHSSVSVTGASLVGGLVGWLAESTIRRSSSTGTVTGSSSDVGGLVGFARSSFGSVKAEVSDSYATGAVSGGSQTGGLIGRVEAAGIAPYEVSVSDSYASGSVSGTTAGGLIGQGSGANLTVTDSFWDTQTTGQSSSAGGTGKTTAEMKTLATFSDASWNITNGWSASTVWGICDGSGYPFLSDQYTSSPCAPPPPSSHILSVTKSASGTGSGTVTSSPSGIDCGSTCEYEFNAGEVVTLTATPASGSTFTGWSGGGCSGTGTCQVTMSEAKSVDAAFTSTPPTPPTPPSDKPKLKVALGGPKRVLAGQPFTVGVRVTNQGSTKPTPVGRSARAAKATSLKTCLKVPDNLFVVDSDKGAKSEGKSVCWTRSSLGTSKWVSYKVSLRSSASFGGSESFQATANAKSTEGATVSAKRSSEIQVKEPKPAPKPEPPTG